MCNIVVFCAYNLSSKFGDTLGRSIVRCCVLVNTTSKSNIRVFGTDRVAKKRELGRKIRLQTCYNNNNYYCFISISCKMLLYCSSYDVHAGCRVSCAYVCVNVCLCIHGCTSVPTHFKYTLSPSARVYVIVAKAIIVVETKTFSFEL